MVITSPRKTSLLNPPRPINVNGLHHFKMLAAIRRNREAGRNGHSSSLLLRNFTRNDVHLMIRNLFIPPEMIKEGRWGMKKEHEREALSIFLNIDLAQGSTVFRKILCTWFLVWIKVDLKVKKMQQKIHRNKSVLKVSERNVALVFTPLTTCIIILRTGVPFACCLGCFLVLVNMSGWFREWISISLQLCRGIWLLKAS